MSFSSLASSFRSFGSPPGARPGSSSPSLRFAWFSETAFRSPGRSSFWVSGCYDYVVEVLVRVELEVFYALERQRVVQLAHLVAEVSAGRVSACELRRAVLRRRLAGRVGAVPGMDLLLSAVP